MARNRKLQRADALARAANTGHTPEVAVKKHHVHVGPTAKAPEPPPVVVEVPVPPPAPPPPPVEKPKKKRYVRPPRVKAPPERTQTSKGLSFAGRVLGKSIASLKEPPLSEKLPEIGGGR